MQFVTPNQPKPPLQERLRLEAARLQAEATNLPHGPLRDETIRKARQAEIALHMHDWLKSPGLQAPR